MMGPLRLDDWIACCGCDWIGDEVSKHNSADAVEEDMERAVVSSANDVDDEVRVVVAAVAEDDGGTMAELDGPEALFTSGEPTKK